jgi:hypothetical protein
MRNVRCRAAYGEPPGFASSVRRAEADSLERHLNPFRPVSWTGGTCRTRWFRPALPAGKLLEFPAELAASRPCRDRMGGVCSEQIRPATAGKLRPPSLNRVASDAAT